MPRPLGHEADLIVRSRTRPSENERSCGSFTLGAPWGILDPPWHGRPKSWFVQSRRTTPSRSSRWSPPPSVALMKRSRSSSFAVARARSPWSPRASERSWATSCSRGSRFRIRLAGVLAVGLAPLAVHPDHQEQGIGSALVRDGIQECRNRDLGLIVVLGHPGNYPRFGFIPAVDVGIRCKWPVDDDAFMALELVPGQAARAKGLIRYAPEFDGF